MSAELQEPLESVLAADGQVPAAFHRYVGRGARPVAVNRTNGIVNLALSIRLLGVYRLTDLVVTAGDLVARVPYTGDMTLYSPCVDIFALAARLSRERDDPETEARFIGRMGWPDLTMEQLLVEPSTRGRLDGGLLQFPLDEQPKGKLSRSVELDRTLGECLELDFMSAIGGSPQWPRERIAAEIARNEMHVRALS